MRLLIYAGRNINSHYQTRSEKALQYEKFSLQREKTIYVYSKMVDWSSNWILMGVTWYDMIWYDMIWYDMIWYEYDMNMIWYDIIWYDMIWYHITSHHFISRHIISHGLFLDKSYFPDKMMLARSTHVGCAFKECPGTKYVRYYVCNYANQ